MPIQPRQLTTLLLTVAIATIVSGCATWLGDTRVLRTKAEDRLVVASPSSFEGGRNKARQVFCAEPSPDVAKALSESKNLGGGLDVAVRSPQSPVEGAGSAALAYSAAKAESMAQLTNRLATIQLLRDGLYRACEAYANGALSEITYAIVLSRIDKLMVTMLSGELVAGNFGQSLAVLGMAASGAAAGTASKAAQDASKSSQDMTEADTARNDLEAKRIALDKSTVALAQCAPEDAACRKTRQEEVATRRGEVDLANTKFTTAFLKARGSVAASTASSASALIAQGTGSVSTTRGAGGTPADLVAAMQRKFVENINADPVVVACLTALDRDGVEAGHGKELVTFCKRSLVDILDFQKDLLRARLIDGQTSLMQSCMSAFQDASATEPKVKAAAGELVKFCQTELVKILETQSRIVTQQRALEDARRIAPVSAEPDKR
jgi:hypothetical protein